MPGLGVVVGKDTGGMRSQLPLCLRSVLAATVLGGVSSPNAELPQSLAGLCRPELSPWVDLRGVSYRGPLCP